MDNCSRIVKWPGLFLLYTTKTQLEKEARFIYPKSFTTWQEFSQSWRIILLKPNHSESTVLWWLLWRSDQ